MDRQVLVRSLSPGPGVQGEAFAEAILEGQGGEAASFDEEPQEAATQKCELFDEVGVFADRDDAGGSDDAAQRFQVVERCLGVQVGERDGVFAKPVGE